MIDDDLYYILLDEVQLIPRFEALPKISENTQIFLVEILKNTQIFLAEISENTQIFLAEILENTQFLNNITELSHVVQVRAEGPKAPSPGHRPWV